MRAGALVLIAACGFKSAPAGHVDDGAGPGSDSLRPIDAMIDGNDALESNARRKSITFVTTKITGNQDDFPVWIDITSPDLSRALPNGADLFFTDEAGTTKLDHQTMAWDPVAHRVQAWVRIPTLRATMPATKIWLNYGDPGPSPAQNPTGVFKDHFVAVWHLEDPINSATTIDSTNTHNGSPTFTTTTSDPAQLGKGLTFRNSNDLITFANPLSGNMPHTISVWVKQPTVTHVSSIINLGTATMNQARWMYSRYTSASIAIGFYTNDWTPNVDIEAMNPAWTLLHWTFEGGNGKNHLYKNGVEIGSGMTLNGVNTAGNTGIIGHAPETAYGTMTGLEGSIDELRIANTARGAGYAITEYNNQVDPNSFYAVGAEETPP